MKRIIFTLFIIHCSLIISNAQSGWYGLNSGTGRQLNSLYFINSNTGWVVGDSIVLKTTDGGINWAIQSLPAKTRNSSVHFINENTGFIVGDRNYSSYTYGVYTFKTTNGGTNWITVNSYTPAIIGTAYFNNVYAVNENIVYRTYGEYLACSNGGGVHKSTDGGITFSTSLGAGDIRGLSFINSQTGWAISYSGGDIYSYLKVFNTTNAGNTWAMRDSINGFNSRAIQFINEFTGYVIAYGAKTMMFKTTNSGLNWSRDTINNYKFRGIHFINSLTGWVAGYQSLSGSNISRTTNGGVNWTDQYLQGTTPLNAIYFSDAMTGWAVGFYGVILKTTNGGVTSLLNNNKEIPLTYSLYQNYPNPFNPVTKIKFDITPLSRGAGGVLTSLKIYDILGKEIQTLVNEQLQPGSYEVTFDGSNLPSGIYFYQLRTGDFVETKKLILLK